MNITLYTTISTTSTISQNSSEQEKTNLKGHHVCRICVFLLFCGDLTAIKVIKNVNRVDVIDECVFLGIVEML